MTQHTDDGVLALGRKQLIPWESRYQCLVGEDAMEEADLADMHAPYK